MPTAKTGTAASNREASSSTVTASLTIPVGATKVIVGEGGFNGTEIPCTGVTLDGGAMTQVGTNVHDGGRHASLWEMRDSDANWPGDGTFDVVASSTGRDMAIGCQCYTGTADVACDGVQTATTSATTPSLTVTSDTDDRVVGFFCTFSAGRTADAADDEIYYFAGGGSAASSYMFDNDGAASVTFDAEYAASVSCARIAANIPGTAGGGGSTPKGPMGLPLNGPFGGPI